MMTVLLIIAGVLLAGILLQTGTPKENSSDLGKIMPIWKIEQGCLLSKKGDITVAFRVILPEVFTQSGTEYNALHQSWLKAIKVLPAGSILHKQDWFVEQKYHPDFNSERPFLKVASDRFFNERPHLSHECYLMVTLKAKDRRPASSALSTLLRKNLLPADTIDQGNLQRLMDLVGQFEGILKDNGTLTIERLTEAELAGTVNTPGLIERYLFLLEKSEGPQIRDIAFKPEMEIGSRKCDLFSIADVEDLPETCSPTTSYEKYSTDKTRFCVGFATPIGQLLPVNHIYSQYLVIGDNSKTLKRLEAKRRRLQSLATYSNENAIGRDATQEFINEAIAKARTPIKAHFNLLCWTEDSTKRKELRNMTASALSRMNVVPRHELKGAAQLWWAGIPGNAAELPENDCFETFAEQASCFLNMETAYRTSNSPFGIRLGDRLTGNPLHVDISDEPMNGVTTNRNKIVVGGSGSGKSMFMSGMLYNYVQQGAHCVVVDVGHSYSGLCKLLGGYYFTYSEENPIRFNPFYIAPGDELDTERKESIKTLLVALWKKDDEAFRRSEYVAISNALQSYYQHLDRTPELFPCFDTFYEFLQEQFVKELEQDRVKDKDFDIHNFLYVLRPFYRGGEFDYLLNATENLDVLQQPFIVFELDKIKDNVILFPIVTLTIMQIFISKMRKLSGIRKVIVIEEAWKAIAKTGMAEFMKYLYKTVRKYFGEAITVTQEVDDIIGSPIIKEAIVNNADCKIILDLRKFQNKFDGILEVLGMTEKARDLVLSINRANEPGRRYREVFIDLGNTLSRVYRFEPSPEEYYAFTTEQSEKMKLEAYTERYGDIRKALSVLGQEYYQNNNLQRA